MNMEKLSAYAQNLPQEAKQRYSEKLSMIKNVNPFQLFRGLPVSSAIQIQQCNLPQVDVSDLVSYLVLQTSFVTLKQFKSHRSLKSYNQFINGWVKDVNGWRIAGKVVVTGRVRHSQRCNDTPLCCWVLCECTGEIICAHCNCMAGLGEVCTHVGAVLFYLETATRISGVSQCTQEKCSWVVPPYQKTIPYAPICEIDFSSVKNKKKAIDAAINCPGPVPEGDSNLVTPAQIQRQQESRSSIRLQAFYSELSKCGCKSTILSLVTEHAHMYIPKSSSPNYPKPLQSLYDPKFLKLGYTDLLLTCAKVDLHVNEDMVSAVESATRDQSKSKLWFKYHAGRITASKMKLACKSDPGLPSQSLIKTICYPEAFGFTTKATKWGCEHERVALDSYIKANTEKHDDFEVSKSGLFLSCDWPFIGASPDGLVNCSCCGKGVVEIKCSYCYRFDSVEKVATDRQSCLVVDADGVLHLSTSHAYYYQVQTQIHVCKVDYCDFCLCTFPSEASLHIERIFPDDQFWQACVDSSQCFFNICVLPELLGRWYSRPHSSVGGQQQTALATSRAYRVP